MESDAVSRIPVEGPGARWFSAAMLGFVALFALAFLALVGANLWYTTQAAVREALASPAVHAALWLSLWTSTVTVLIGLFLAIPTGYALSRYRFPGHSVVDALVDLPIILPPVIAGLILLVFFQTSLGRWIESSGLTFVYSTRGIILCQLLVSLSLGIRALKIAFDGIDPRLEHVAMTLGCTRAGAFWRTTLPLARRGIAAAGILIWTRSFGLFGPLMVFVGTMHAVLPTLIYLEQSIGRLELALALALFMILAAAVALVLLRLLLRRFV